MKRYALLALILLSCSLPLRAATEVIPLNYRTADEVLAIVQSTLGNEGKANAYGNQLIVNASPSKIDEVRQLLQQLDTAPRRLLITVDSSESNTGSDQGYRVDGTISSGNGQINIGQGEVNGRDQVRIIRRSTDSRSGGSQQVQATEGYPALVQVGQSVPLRNRGLDAYGNPYSNTQYRDVTRGFYVTASVSGELVHLSISSHNDRLNQSYPGVIDVQNTDTRVTGRLGQWIRLSGVSQQNANDRSDVLQHRSTQGHDDMNLRVKVDLVE